jgi:hypothetical protein
MVAMAEDSALGLSQLRGAEGLSVLSELLAQFFTQLFTRLIE